MITLQYTTHTLAERQRLKAISPDHFTQADNALFPQMKTLTVKGHLQDNTVFLGLCTCLQELDASHCVITDIGPLENLTALATLNLSVNEITNAKPLANLTALTTLNLGMNQITNAKPLANLTALTFLHIWSNKITNIEPLKNLTALTTLNLSANKITNIEPLKNLTALTTLCLANNNIPDTSLLATLLNLTMLYLHGNKITETLTILPLHQLKDIRTDACERLDSIFKIQGPHKHLLTRYLEFSKPDFLTPEAKKAFKNPAVLACLQELREIFTRSINFKPGFFAQFFNRSGIIREVLFEEVHPLIRSFLPTEKIIDYHLGKLLCEPFFNQRILEVVNHRTIDPAIELDLPLNKIIRDYLKQAAAEEAEEAEAASIAAAT